MAHTKEVKNTTPKFAAFILTNGRPDNVVTYKQFRDAGYTGDIYLIVDDEDKTIDQYRKNFGSQYVIQFNKTEAEKMFDVADTQPDRRAVSYARNMSFKIAKQLGLDYFIQLDDDYNFFKYRWIEHGKLISADILSMDRVIEAMIGLLDTTGALTVAMSQGGDHLGGIGGNIRKPLLRKAMNTLLVKTSKPFEFIGKVNDDVNTYVVHGSRGELFFTSTVLHANQLPTQQNAGGMTDLYLETGTYMKSMYTVMMQPSSVTIRLMGKTNRRLHHHVDWNHTVPKIISDKHRKP